MSDQRPPPSGALYLNAPLAVRYDRHPAARPVPRSLPMTPPAPPARYERWSPADRFAPFPVPIVPAVTAPAAAEAPPPWAAPPAPPLQFVKPSPQPAPEEPRLFLSVPAATQPRAAPRRKRLAWPLALGAVAVLLGTVAAATLLPPRFAAKAPASGLFNAPMMVLRASSGGLITDVAVSAGQAVEPTTRLLTVHTDAPADLAAAAARARLDILRARIAAFDEALAQLTPAADPTRTRTADLRAQRAAAAAEWPAAQDAFNRISPKPGADWPVLAGLHGIVRSLEIQSGAAITPGTPLVRMLDCDHAFLTVSDLADLHAGEAVEVRIPALGTVGATVRASTGVAEPQNSLIVPLTQASLDGACPVGGTATIVPVAAPAHYRAGQG